MKEVEMNRVTITDQEMCDLSFPEVLKFVLKDKGLPMKGLVNPMPDVENYDYLKIYREDLAATEYFWKERLK